MGKHLLNSFGLLAGTGLLLASCSGKDDNVKGNLVTRNDFEAVLGWGGNADVSVTSEKAHSGKYSVKVGPQNEYGYTYVNTLGNMSTAKTKAITVSAWVWMPNNQQAATLALSVTRSPEQGASLFYGGIDLSKAVTKYNSWQKVSQTFTMPDTVRSMNQLKCYLWRTAANDNVYADDITISVND